MLLFAQEISFSKFKCFIDIVASFLQTYGSILLKRNITFSDLLKSTNLEYLASTSSKKCFLKLLCKLHYSSSKNWHILRFSEIFRKMISISLNS